MVTIVLLMSLMFLFLMFVLLAGCYLLVLMANRANDRFIDSLVRRCEETDNVWTRNNILIIGLGGSGKTTMANRLSDRLSTSNSMCRLYHIPVIHMDQLSYKPGWISRSEAEFATEMAKAFSPSRQTIVEGLGYRNQTYLASNIRAGVYGTVVLIHERTYIRRLRILMRSLRRKLGWEELGAGGPESLSNIWHMLLDDIRNTPQNTKTQLQFFQSMSTIHNGCVYLQHNEHLLVTSQTSLQ